MPVDYKKYPSDWKTAIRPAILKRANDCCEFCGLANHSEGLRDKSGKFIDWVEIENALNDRGYDYFDNELKHHLDKHGRVDKLLEIVLTIAHLNHNILDNREQNLKALCQQCHNRYDAQYRKKNRRNTRIRKMGALTLFS
jgi:hypothetical protein